MTAWGPTRKSGYDRRFGFAFDLHVIHGHHYTTCSICCQYKTHTTRNLFAFKFSLQLHIILKEVTFFVEMFRIS